MPSPAIPYCCPARIPDRSHTGREPDRPVPAIPGRTRPFRFELQIKSGIPARFHVKTTFQKTRQTNQYSRFHDEMTNIRLPPPCPYTGAHPPGTSPRTVTGQTFLHAGFRLPSIVQPPAHPEKTAGTTKFSKQDFGETGGTICLPHRFQLFFEVSKSAIPARQSPKAHLYRISGTPPERENTTGILHHLAPVSPGKPRFGKLVGPAFPVHMFSKEKLSESTENGWADTSSAKKYRRGNNEIIAQPAWSLASRILRDKTK